MKPGLFRRVAAWLMALVFLSWQTAEASYKIGGTRVIAGIPYVLPSDGVRLGDVYLPQSKSGLRPAVLYIHGGGWTWGSKDESRAIALALARHGFVVFNCNYRLLGQGGEFPGNLLDVRDALSFLCRRSREWMIDSGKLAAMGDSAGGQLSMLLGYAGDKRFGDGHSAKTSARVGCVVSWYGPSDLSRIRNRTTSRYLVGAGKSACRLASPLSYAGGAVPTLFVHGRLDPFVPLAQSEMMYNALRSRHITAKLVVLQEGHIFSPVGWLAAMNETIEFLDQQFGSGKPPLGVAPAGHKAPN